MTNTKPFTADPRKMTRAILGLLVIVSTCVTAMLWALGFAEPEHAKDAMIILGNLSALVFGFYFKQDADETTNGQDLTTTPPP